MCIGCVPAAQLVQSDRTGWKDPELMARGDKRAGAERKPGVPDKASWARARLHLQNPSSGPQASIERRIGKVDQDIGQNRRMLTQAPIEPAEAHQLSEFLLAP
jgi:hypothetical protein